MTPTELRRRLRARLASGEIVVAPGIYDAYGARFVAQAGFEAVYMTGNGVSASLLGRPDVGLVDLTLLSQHAHRAAAAVDIPLICDADTGYGNAVNVRRTVEEFEAAVAAKRDAEFIIIARTDSAESRGLDEAISRAQTFILSLIHI